MNAEEVRNRRKRRRILVSAAALILVAGLLVYYIWALHHRGQSDEAKNGDSTTLQEEMDPVGRSHEAEITSEAMPRETTSTAVYIHTAAESTGTQVNPDNITDWKEWRGP